MQRSSESIAKLASALAKAQIELVNPKKSLVGTIYPEDKSQEARSFNYASLASGLEIVRKTLGQHEIAVIQTTAIEEATQIVKLTTVLAHASGEWMASDWPVCAVAETATPQRMGMALTYARRNSLFALVGIAGEDDLDAPSQLTPTDRGPDAKEADAGGDFKPSGGYRRPGVPSPRGDRNARKSCKPMLDPKASAHLRDRLLMEMKGIASTDDATLWAYCNFKAKNGLIAEDAACVEDAFRATLATLDKRAEEADQPLRSGDRKQKRRRKLRRPPPIDKSVLSFPEPRRVRDRDHIRFVAKQACLICGRQPSDAHHLRFAQHSALGRKASDEFTVPLCRGHHREVHRHGDEAAWWSTVRIDPLVTARALWLQTHRLPRNSDKDAAVIGGESVAPLPAVW